MSSLRVSFRSLGFAVVGFVGGMSAYAEPAPKLAVVISVDQGRADYLQRFRPWFGEGGFNRLLTDGRVFTECRYRHAVTKTAPGHATILSGVHADVHGIIGNDWIKGFDGAKPVWTVGVGDDDSALVGLLSLNEEIPAKLTARNAGRSPRNFLASTVGDQLKLRFGDRSRVVSVAGKDRAAILMGGKLADEVYWRELGRAVTSTYYRDALPAWVTAFNQDHAADAKFGAVWSSLLDPAIYDRVQGVDDAPGETSGEDGLPATLPKTINGGAAKITSKFYDAFDVSPFAVTQLMDLALAAVQADQLGHHDTPDLLCIGVSQTDKSGHLYGPDSHEVMDGFLRLDRELARLFAGLDAAVGADNYVVVLTADHGVAPLPERVAASGGGLPSGRLNTRDLDRQVFSALDVAFGAPAGGAVWAVRDGGAYRLVPTTLAAQGVDAAAARTVLKVALLASPEIAGAWTREELLAGRPDGDDVMSLERRSYHAVRGADVVFGAIPYVISRSRAGANHGEAYDYDRHVPMLWMGPGVPAGFDSSPVAVEDLARTLAALLGVEPPPQAQGRRLF